MIIINFFKRLWISAKNNHKLANFAVSLILTIVTLIATEFFASGITKFERYILAILVFIVTEITLYILFHEDEIVKRISSLRMENEKKVDPHFTELFRFLAEESYGRCSKEKPNCKGCEELGNGCNGLLRHYIYEDCLELMTSIKKARNGIYFLNTNVEQYHNIAIEHLFAFGCKDYCVIQSIKKRDAELYDSLDFHFLKELLRRVISSKEPYIKEVPDFKIHWLFVNESNEEDFKKNIKFNYDYILYVINTFTTEEIKKINKIIEFRVIPKDSYQQMRRGQKKYDGYLDYNTPSIGIFGDKFVFVDSQKFSLEHGNIYTEHLTVKEISNFFNNDLWIAAKNVDYKELKENYDKLVKIKDTEHQDYGKVLRDKWMRSST